MPSVYSDCTGETVQVYADKQKLNVTHSVKIEQRSEAM